MEDRKIDQIYRRQSPKRKNIISSYNRTCIPEYHSHPISLEKIKKRIFMFSLIFLFFFSLSLLGQENKLTVVAESANIHDSPDKESPVIATVKKGTVLYLLAKEKIKDIWYYVYFYSRERKATIAGYIQETMIESGVEIPQEKEREEVKTLKEVTEEVVYKPPKEMKIEFKYGIGVTGGYVITGDDNYDNGIKYGGRFCLGITKFLSLELSGINYRNSVEESVGGLSKGKINIIVAQLSIQARFPVSQRYIPYIFTGGGFYLNRFSLDGEITEAWEDLGFDIKEEIKNSIGYHLGAGLDFVLSRNIVGNVDVQYCFVKTKGSWAFTEQMSGIEANGELAGLNLGAFMLGAGLKFCF